MKLYDHPLGDHPNKFVITEDAAYFVPCLDNTPSMVEILGEILDLKDPKVHREVDGKLFGGRIILGHYEPSTREVIIQTPLEPSEYLKKRIEEVFGD